MPDQTITEGELESIKFQLKGRSDPVFFGKFFLGLDFYPQQMLWLWMSTKTQKERAKELLKKLGICFTTPANFDQDIDKIYDKIQNHIFCVNNQAGKTLMTSVKHIWSCFYKIGKKGSSEHQALDDYKTLNVSPHSDQANKCFEYVQRICKGEFIWYGKKTDNTKQNVPLPFIKSFVTNVNQNEKEINFSNGSTFWSKSIAQDTGTARAGEQFGFISFDEASQSLHLEDAIVNLVHRLIRYGYSFDIISTPEATKPGHSFYLKIVKDGIKLNNSWFALTGITLDDNVFIDPGQKTKIKKQIKEMSPEKYQQIVMGKFISLGRRLFDLHAVSNMFDLNLKQIQCAQPARKYILSVDWAMSDEGGDKTWYIVIDYTDYLEHHYNIVYHEIMATGEPYMKYAVARDLYNRFGGDQQCKFIMDNSAMGGTIIRRELIDLKPIGMDYTHNKDEMLMQISMSLNFNRELKGYDEKGEPIQNKEFGKLKSYPIDQLNEQLTNYHTNDKKLEQDGVMTLGQAVWFIEKLPKNIDIELDLNPMKRYNNVRLLGRK